MIDGIKFFICVFLFFVMCFCLGMLVYIINRAIDLQEKACYPNVVLGKYRLDSGLFLVCSAEGKEYRIVKLEE